MKYRFLGDSGLLVSGDAHAADDRAYVILRHAFEKGGINFFDTVECYGRDGAAERTLGAAVRRGVAEGVWPREDLVLTTKIFMGTTQGPNAHGLGRKHLVEGTKDSLKRLGLNHVDVLFCHRPDPRTPIEETVHSMNFIIGQGWAFYLGTSEWSSHDILKAYAIADRLGMIRPIVGQPQYNLSSRSRVEFDLADVYDARHKMGLTTFSPLAYSVLTGKYADGIPQNARLADPKYTTFVPEFQTRIQQAEALRPIAVELGCSMAQLALACVAQLEENLGALDVVAKLTPEIKRRIESVIPICPTLPTLDTRYSTMRDKYVNAHVLK